MEDIALTFPYTAFDLTEQVNVVPNLYGMLNEMNLFPTEGSISTIIEMRYENKVLRVLPAKERGSSSTPMKSETGKSVFLEVPHFPASDLITPQDLQNILVQVGRTKRPATLADEVNKRLISIRNTHAISREWIRAGALQGLITDGNGSTLYNLYTVFGISNTPLDFVLGTSGTDVAAKCAAVWQAITSNLKGEVMNGIEAIVDPGFFEELISHPNVIKYWLQAEQALALANNVRVKRPGNMWGREFTFQRITFRENYGAAPVVSDGSPTTAPFWAAGTGTAYPVGTLNMFRTFDAPANDLRFVNTLGQEVYVSPKILDHGEGVELKSESNALAVCRRPEATYQIFTSN